MSAAWLSIWVPVVIVDGINSLANLVLMIVLISVVPVSLVGFLLYHAWLDNRAGGQSSARLAGLRSRFQTEPPGLWRRPAATACANVRCCHIRRPAAATSAALLWR